MELIYENAGNWNVDTGRIAIIGFFAGGHLAAHWLPDLKAWLKVTL